MKKVATSGKVAKIRKVIFQIENKKMEIEKE
jgi:hypothetical protein